MYSEVGADSVWGPCLLVWSRLMGCEFLRPLTGNQQPQIWTDLTRGIGVKIKHIAFRYHPPFCLCSGAVVSVACKANECMCWPWDSAHLLFWWLIPHGTLPCVLDVLLWFWSA